MERFVKRHSDRIVGSIAGFDQMLFRGNLGSICHVEGMDRFCRANECFTKTSAALCKIFPSV